MSISALQRDTDAFQMQIQSKQNDIDREQQRLAEHERNNDDAKILASRKIIEDLTRDIAVISQDIQRRNDQAQSEQQKLQEIDKNIQTLMNEVEAAEQRIKSETDHVDTLRKRIDDLNAQKQVYE